MNNQIYILEINHNTLEGFIKLLNDEQLIFLVDIRDTNEITKCSSINSLPIHKVIYHHLQKEFKFRTELDNGIFKRSVSYLKGLDFVETILLNNFKVVLISNDHLEPNGFKTTLVSDFKRMGYIFESIF